MGAVCGKAARTDLSGGREVTRVPTATVAAAIAGIGDTAIEDVADERLHLRNDRAERVPVIGIAGQCCSMGDKMPAGGMLHRGGDRVQGIDLAARAGGAPVPARAGPGTAAVRTLPAR